MELLRVQFINENIFRWARVYKGMRRGVSGIRSNRKLAENAGQLEKVHLWLETR